MAVLPQVPVNDFEKAGFTPVMTGFFIRLANIFALLAGATRYVLTENRAVISDAAGGLAASDVTSTELGYLDGATSNIQSQINTHVGNTDIHIDWTNATDNFLTTGTVTVDSDASKAYFGADQDFEVYFNGTVAILDATGDPIRIGDASTYLEVADNGDAYFVGAGSGLPYGSMYADDISETVTVSATGTFYEVSGGNFTAGQNNLTSLDGSYRIQVSVAGKYKVDWGMVVETLAANQYIEGTVCVNTTPSVQAVGATELAISGKQYQISGTAILALSANDYVSLCVDNETATQDIIVTHGNMSLVMVGG